ncbi:MAG: hypothetical protein KF861_01350 [Planctomycetaceae bacterium]|nr:hypothetical protein [Planctomycetaceae bacterium]
MAERRPLVEGLKSAPPAIPTPREQEFVYGKGAKAVETPAKPAAITNIATAPLSTRIRGDYATALKRASLERQLDGVEPNTLREILETALEPWLKTNGYIP